MSLIPNTKIIGVDTFIEPNEFVDVNNDDIDPEIPSTVINNIFGPRDVNMGGTKYNISKQLNAPGIFSTTINTIGETYTVNSTNTPASFVYDSESALWNSLTVQAWPKNEKDRGIVGVGAIGGELQGSPAVVSGDDNYLIIGARNNYGRRGTIWVYKITTPGGVQTLTLINQFTLVQDPIIPTPSALPISAAMSFDASYILFGTPNSQLVGIYIKSSTDVINLQQTLTIPAAAIGTTIRFGYSVSTTNDGTILIIGSPYENAQVGSAWIYRKVTDQNVWNLETKLAASDNIGAAEQGTVVDISPTGGFVAIGGPADNAGVGAVWIYQQLAIGTWSQRTKILPTGGIGAPGFGIALKFALSGQLLAIGGSNDNVNIGAIWVYRRTDDFGATWVNEAKLVPTGTTPASNFGTTLSITSDGSCLSGGAPTDNGSEGAVWVFNRNSVAQTWSQTTSTPLFPSDSISGFGSLFFGDGLALLNSGQNMYIGARNDDDDGAFWLFSIQDSLNWGQVGIKMRVPDTRGITQQGFAVSLNNDAFRLGLSGSTDSNQTGALYLFERTYATNWTQVAKLVGRGFIGTPLQGTSCSIDKPGQFIASGGLGDNGNIGAAWVFYRYPNGEWRQVGNPIRPSDNVGASQFGISISFSYDATYLAVGGFTDDANLGATWVFIKSGTGENSVWTQQAKLIGVPNTATDRQGRSVSLSSEGTYLAVGADQSPGVGAVYIFLRTGTTWATQQRIIVVDNVGNSSTGNAVSINAQGDTVLFGGSNDNANVGAVWVWTRAGAVWTQQAKIIPPDVIGAARVGRSVSINANGNIIAFGGSEDNATRGAIWIYTRSGVTWTYREKLTTNFLTNGFGIGCNITYRGHVVVGGASASELALGGGTIFA